MGDVKQNAIPYTKERCLKAAISELVDDYETIKREVVELREHNKYLEMRVSEESDYAELEARHNALRDAVAWEREFDEVLVWLVRTGRYPRDMAGKYDLANERECARAEVGRLIASQGSADCQGEE